MENDYIRNGQLKPAYNVHLGVNSEYSDGYGVFSNSTDSGTRKPMPGTQEEQHRHKYGSVAAAGYES